MKSKFYKHAACFLTGITMAVSVEAQTIYTFCGTTSGYSGDGGPATAAGIDGPAAIRIKGGELYFVDAINNRVRKISGSAYTINTFLGDGTNGSTGDGGAATSARINPGSVGGGIAFDNSGNVYYSDLYNHRIRKVSSSGTVSTIAGTTLGFSGDGGPASAAQFSYPVGISSDAAGNIYVADQGNHRIRKIDAATGNISTVAGSGTSGYSGDGGPATAADLSNPYDVVVDAAGNLYISDYSNYVIRKVTASTGIISTYASGFMGVPAFLELDKAGNLFIGSEDNYGQIFKVSTSGVVTHIAGNGTTTLATGDAGPATAAGMSKPVGVAVSPMGDLFITNKANDRIRIVVANAATITGTATMCAGVSVTLTASIPGAAWESSNTGIASVSSTGVVTGVAAGTATITYVAGLIFGTKVVTVNAPAVPVITATGTTLSVPAVYATYQWSLGGTPISGAVGASYNATTAGTYAVNVTDAGGCSTTSAGYVLSSVSVASVNKGGLQLFPNPAVGGMFTINLPSEKNETVTIVVVNMLGEKVYETKALANTSLTIKMNVPSGIYTVRATSADADYRANVVVN